MRKYEPLWKAIKKNPALPVTIQAEPEHCQRIVRGVIKEKDKDIAFKLEQQDIYATKYRLQWERKGKFITFSLIAKEAIDLSHL